MRVATEREIKREATRGYALPELEAVRGVVVGRLIEREQARTEAARAAWRALSRKLERSGPRAWA